MNSIDLVVNTIKALNQINIPYMLVGSLSSNLYGVPRNTKDADIVVQLGNTPLSTLAKALGTGFKMDPQVGFETITSTTRYRIEHPETGFMIELFELSDDPHDRERFSRRRQITIEDHPTFAASPEDVIITKIRWSRGGKSRAKDIRDVQDVLAVQTPANLDMSYIRKWTAEHGTTEILEKLLSEI